MRNIHAPIVPDMLRWSFTQLPHDHVAGWREGAIVTHAQLRAQANAWRATLTDHPGQRFALYMGDTLEFAAALFGAWLAGKTIVLPSDALDATCQALQHDVSGFIGDYPPSRAPLLPAPHSSIADVPWPEMAADFPALVVYTSGSTGQAQAIPKQLSQLATEVATLEHLFGARLGTAEIVSTVSHQHIYGLLFNVLWPLSAGRAVHATSAFFAEDLQRIAPTRPWILLSSPAHLKRFPDNPTLPDTGMLRAVFSSGGPLLEETAQQIRTLFGHRPIEVYGSSETGGIAWRQPDAADAPVWHLMPGIQVRLGAEDTLELQSPHLPDRDWFTMADRVELTANGDFFLRGRVDRLVKLEEKRISLDRIERLMVASGLVSDARVLVHQGKGQRQFIAAFAVPTAAGKDYLAGGGKHALNTALRRALADAIEGIALPRLWRYLDAMPVNTQGKITVAALQALLDEKPADHADRRPTTPEITASHCEGTQATLELRVPENLLYFDGHFPDAPILPGVVQTDWALALGRRFFALPPVFKGIQALKFQRIISPGAAVTLELQHDTEKHSLTFKLHSSAGQHASGRILLGAAA